MFRSKTTQAQIEKAQDHIDEAMAHLRYNRFDLEVESYKLAIASNPNCDIAYVYYGSCLRSEGKIDEAIGYYKKALTINPDNLRATYWMAYAKDNGAGSKEFLAVVDKIIKAKAKTFDDYKAKSFAYAKKEDIESQITMLQEALKLKSDPGTSYNLGRLLYDNDKYAEAEIACRNATIWDNDYGNAWHMLGSACKYQGKYAEAIEYYKKAHDINPNDPLLYADLGQVLYWNGDEAESIKSFNKAFELYHDPVTRANLADGNDEFMESIFSHERADLLAKFTELSETQITPIDITQLALVDQEEVQQINEEVLAANARKKAVMNTMPQAMDAQSDPQSAEIPNMQQLQDMLGIIKHLQLRLEVIEAPAKYISNIQAQPKIFTYHASLMLTFEAAWTSSLVTLGGKHSIDTSSTLVTIASSIASTAPMVGSAASSLISGGYSAFKAAEVKKDASKVASFISASGGCEKLVLHLSMKLTMHPNKYHEIEHAGQQPAKSSGIFSLLFSKLKNLGDDFNAKLNGDCYKAPESKLARDDALKVLAAIEDGAIKREAWDTTESLVDKFCACVLGDDASEAC